MPEQRPVAPVMLEPTGIEPAIVDPATLKRTQVLALYNSVGWSAYTKEPQLLFAALAGSSAVAAAEVDGVLIGLARVVSDGASICYLQDVLVHPEHQRTGLGARLVSLLLERYPLVRQKVLLTDDEPGQAAFYAALGFSLVGGDQAPAVRSFVRFD